MNELKAAPPTGAPSDSMVQKFNFDRKYQVIIPDKKDWEKGSPIRADSNWYTDGSKTEHGVGAGIYGGKPRKALSISFSKDTTVFQAEVAAIHHCVREVERWTEFGKSVAIFSNSQATLKAISSASVDSKLVWDCVNALNEVGSQRNLILAWVPSHEGVKGNEAADDLTRQGSSRQFVGPAPSFGTTQSQIRKSINEWIHSRSRDWWLKSPGQRQAKEFLKEQKSEFTRDLLDKDRKTVKMLVGLLTGHCRLNRPCADSARRRKKP